VSTVAHGLQAIAQDLNIAVIILSQISGENLKSNNIELISGKGAKDLEEVANVQIILQRKKVDTEGNDPSLMHIVVNKNRDGQTGVTDARVEFPNMVIKTIYG
jgi:replicative DNA helicase